jgi:hypothetical protein
MIPYADLERAIARWKARQAGHEVQAPLQEGSAYAYGDEGRVETTSELDAEPSGVISIEDDEELS